MEHSRDWNGWRGALLGLLAGTLAIAPLSEMAAQYPGHIDIKVKTGPVLRSIAVLEWTGQPGKPGASRLVPVSVFEDGAYQAGGLYLARPAPMALESGTEYQLLQTGVPKGLFDVGMAQQVGDEWIGYGTWKPLPPPAPFHKLKPAKVDPEVVDGGSDRRPHFRKAAPDADAPGGGSAVTPPDDPDRPTLRKRAGGSTDAGGSSTSPDTDTSPAATNGSLETATAGGDPDRPKLSRGIPKDQPKEPQHLEGTPPNLEQMVAVSDAASRPEHSFAYSWATPDDAAKMQAQLEEIARKAIAKASLPAGMAATTTAKGATRTSSAPASSNHASSTKTHASTGASVSANKAAGTSGRHTATSRAVPAAGKAAAHSTPAQAAARRRRALAAKKSSATPVMALTDVQFHAFELTYSGGATLVFSARTMDEEAKVRYVTVIAQPDIYGVPQVLFTQVTCGDDLDASPRLRLVDAVDAAADNRGELLFELRGATVRQFALYRVGSGRVDQMIATGLLPLGHGAAE